MSLINEIHTLQLTRNHQTLEVFLDKLSYQQDIVSMLHHYAQVEELEEGIKLIYKIPEFSVSLTDYQHQLHTKLDKLKLAEKLAYILSTASHYHIPYLTTDNIFIDGEYVFVLHHGLKDMVYPFTFDQSEALQDVKALILSLFNPELDSKHLKFGQRALNDDFSQQLNVIQQADELLLFLKNARVVEQQHVLQVDVQVSKKTYNIYRWLGIATMGITIIIGSLLYYYYTDHQKQQAIVMSQANFMINHYSEAQKNLEEYDPTNLPKSAKYVLATSSIQLADLTEAQKQVVLNTISYNSDDNTLNYWVYTGRGKFDKALDLAQNLGDVQLILLAYTNLYQATQLDTHMDGAKKQELLTNYSKQIEELSKKLMLLNLSQNQHQNQNLYQKKNINKYHRKER